MATTRYLLDYGLREPLPLGRPDGSGEQERAFVMRSMTMALRSAPEYRDLTPAGFEPYVEELEDRLDDPSLVRLIAYDPMDPWLILGFVIGSRGHRFTDPSTGVVVSERLPVLTYLHVKGGFRGLGLAYDLAAHLGIVPGEPAIAEFVTWDLRRDRPGTGRPDDPGSRPMPVGLLHNPRWGIEALPWRPE